MLINLLIDRFDPNRDRAGYKQQLKVEVKESGTVLDALIKAWQQDPGISFRRSCRSAICGSCAMLINGEPRLACQTLLKDVVGPDGSLSLEPMPGFRRIKDLVVDLQPFFDSLKDIIPWVLTRADHDGLMSPEDAAKIENPATCILCGLCDSQLGDGRGVGPAAVVKNIRLALDTRDMLGLLRLRLNQKHPREMAAFREKLKKCCPKKIELPELKEV